MTTTESLPIACVPDAIPAAEHARHVRLARALFGAGAAVEPVAEAAEGYRVELDGSKLDDVARWVAHERRCCPFLRFVLDVAPGGGPLALTLTGPGGTRALLDAELLLLEEVP